MAPIQTIKTLLVSLIRTKGNVEELISRRINLYENAFCTPNEDEYPGFQLRTGFSPLSPLAAHTGLGVSALLGTYGRRLDVFGKFQGMRSSMRL
jgi:hypothetical protein